MLVVSNTSPICNLAVIGRLEFLQRRYSVVLGGFIHAKPAGRIPNVRDEIRRQGSEAGIFVAGSVEKFILSQVGERFTACTGLGHSA